MEPMKSRELENTLQELGYPFDPVSGALNTNVMDKNLNSKFTKDSLCYEILDKEASDKQLLACCDVKKFCQYVPPYFAALSSNNGMQAFERLSSYDQLIGHIVMGFFKEGSNLRVHIEYLKEYYQNSRFSLLVDQISLINLLRTGTNKKIKPVSISSKYSYGPILTSYIGIKPQKSIDNYLVFKSKDLFLPFLTQNDIIWNLMEPGLEKDIKKQESGEQFSAIIRKTLFNLIAGGNFQLKDVADTLGITPRTCQRWLHHEGTNFKTQLEIVRKVLAFNLLQDMTLTTAEVSFLIGFSNTTSFYKAFKKWTGKPVLKYRREATFRKILDKK